MVRLGPRGIMESMRTPERRSALRWLAPVVVAALAAGAGSLISTVTATARDSLPPRTAQELLVDVQGAELDGLSGTLSVTTDLGLPALPGSGRRNTDFSALLSGTNTLRVWSAGADQLRVALMGRLGESDLVRNGNDVWTWASSDQSVSHLTVPERTGADRSDSHESDSPELASSLTPQQLADRAIEAITPSTEVSTDPTAVVAGRPAYQLVLEPKADTTLVGSVRIAIDGATRVPTRVQVYAAGASTPALEVGFTSFDPTPPDPSVFEFTPPEGATVTERELPGGPPSGDTSDAPGAGSDQAPGFGSFLTGGVTTRVVGEDWSSVGVADLPIQLPSADEAETASGPLATISGALDVLPRVSGDWGSGHLLRGALFSVLVTDDGEIVAGAVPPQLLYDALAAP